MAVVADISHDAKEIYDSIAEQYVEVKKAPHRTAVEQYTLFDVMLLKNEPELGKGARILDMACGNGHCTRKLRELFPEASYICGVDISSSIIGIAKQCESQLQQNIDYIDGDGKDLPISEPLYDIVTAAYYLNYAQTCDELRIMIKVFKRSVNIQPNVNLSKQMKSFNDNKQFNKTIELFDKLIKNDTNMLSSFNITQVLKACAHLKDIQHGKMIHHLISSRIKDDDYILASLIHLYMQCGDTINAELLFDTATKKSLSMYAAMMKGYIKTNQANKAIDLFNEIKNPDEVIIILLFNACAQLANKETLHLIKDVTSKIPKSFYLNSYLLTSQIDALMKCRDIPNAEALFGKTLNKTLSMYGAMMKGYLLHNEPNKAVNLFNEIKNPDEVIIILLFNACAQLANKEALYLIEKVSKQIPESFKSNPRILTSLLDAFIKCSDMKNAQLLFDKTLNKTVPMYGAMMKGYISNNMINEAIELFNKIKNPGEIAFTLFFNACAQLATKEALKSTEKVSKQIPESFKSSPRLLTSLLDALMKCGDTINAQLLFDKTLNKIIPMYGAMMKGYLDNNEENKVINLFNEIKHPNEIIIILFLNACAQLGNDEGLNLVKNFLLKNEKICYSISDISLSIIDAFISCGDDSSAKTYLSKIEEKIENSITDYEIIMNGYNKLKDPFQTLDLFNKIKINNIETNEKIYLNVIKALSEIGDYSLSESIIQQIPKDFLFNDQIENSLIAMWGKNGCVNKAKEIFDKSSQPDRIEYKAMINSYGLNGMGIQAVELYYKMPKELQDERTHICVLNACSHSGLIDEARLIFKNTQRKTRRIYTTMVDCLSRASLFIEAEKFIEEFERDYSPYLPMYMSLLSGARNVNNMHLSEKIHHQMEKKFPCMKIPLTSASVLLSNVYGSLGEIDKALNIQMKIQKSGVNKKVGLSRTVVNGQGYKFRAHDKSHPRSKEIYDELKKLSAELIEHGHKYDSSCISRPLNEGETVESVLNGHSERLAIAWNFVVNPNASRIQLTKNLRVCKDCHRATKLIALIRQCEIIVRDANRIHHFYKNGQCSCKDYF
ncbi:unnamed protein product [Adineta steineri]|uniref:Uncharacterized protein n=1 Tax=Adineta steineri TaxID=433720 RepID=A0A814E282_9BILA|nr:unnamed protein product [Adineta steineri]CAF1535679.1 unnamed protein product [Adineta steineri]